MVSHKLANRDITVRKFTMKDVHNYLEGMEKDNAAGGRPHVMDILFNDDVTARAVSMATGLSMEELAGNYTHDEMRALIDKVRAENPFFVGMMERIVKIKKKIPNSNNRCRYCCSSKCADQCWAP